MTRDVGGLVHLDKDLELYSEEKCVAEEFKTGR
jgi:hypothetical protein